jgi:putative heme iron utilization protein
MTLTLTDDERNALRRLLRETRWAALATARDNEPLSTWVAVVPDGGGYLMHISHLAQHTRFLLTNPRASLSFSETDADASRDPQTLARVCLQGQIEWIARDSPTWNAAQARYLSRLPQAAVQFQLGDFYLARFAPETVRYIPGFGRAHRINGKELDLACRGS